jgi:hypothetical protein
MGNKTKKTKQIDSIIFADIIISHGNYDIKYTLLKEKVKYEYEYGCMFYKVLSNNVKVKQLDKSFIFEIYKKDQIILKFETEIKDGHIKIKNKIFDEDYIDQLEFNKFKETYHEIFSNYLYEKFNIYRTQQLTDIYFVRVIDNKHYTSQEHDLENLIYGKEIEEARIFVFNPYYYLLK